MIVERPLLAPQPIHRGALVAVGRESQRCLGERLPALGRLLEGQGDGEVGPLDQVLRRRQEVVQHAGQRRVRRPEAGPEEVRERRDHLSGDRGRDQLGSLRIE